VIQLSYNEASNPGADPFTTRVFVGIDLCVVLGAKETSMKTEALGHVCCDADIHPSLVVDSGALWSALRPRSEKEERLNEVDRFVW
jgi:hypothetical protein